MVADHFAARAEAMRTTAYLPCGDWHHADDVVQVAFTKLYLAYSRGVRADPSVAGRDGDQVGIG